MNSLINLLGNMSEKEFTHQFWGKKPCFIEGVIKGYQETITKKILCTLIQDDHIDTKLITQKDDNFITDFGPFKKNSLNREVPYTLLVHKFHLWHKFSSVLFSSIGEANHYIVMPAIGYEIYTAEEYRGKFMPQMKFVDQ